MPEKMAAVVQYALKPLSVELREVPVPQPGVGDVLLRVDGVGICGSDVHQYHNTQSWTVDVPVTLGHEFCGTIVAAGRKVQGFKEGDRVACETAAEIDPNSPLTRAGKYNLDPARRGFGYNVDGAMAEFVRVPSRCLHHLPKGLPPEVAAVTEPCCVAYQAVGVNSHVKAGDIVVVVGPGPIGILSAQVAKLFGAGEVIIAGLERDRPRMEIALKTGATKAALVEEVPDLLKGMGDGLGADLVVDAAGVSASLEKALKWVRPTGQVTKVGWGPQPLGFSLDSLVRKAVTLQGSFSHTWPVWERVLSLLESGRLDVGPIVSRVAPLAEWKTCFESMKQGKLLKVVFKP